ncbi:HAMP domain-containing histidine kinase, partial [Massilia arenosa]
PMPNLQAQLATEVRHEVERRNIQLLDDLEQGRSRLTVQVLASLAVAGVLAVGFGYWMSRPLAAIGDAIDRLGANKYDQKIDVDGPHDLSHVGRQLDWLRTRLAALEEDKARFLRHVSHELKTPLAAICEGVSLLDDGLAGHLTPRQQEIVGILRQNTSALQAQIEDLLRYNEASFGAQHLHREPVDLATLVKSALDKQRLQLEAAGVHAELTGSVPPVRVDVDKITAAIANLISNAARYSPRGATIWLGLSQREGKATLDCIDSGAGVAEADVAKIFQPFYQGERQPAGARKGNGIGLSIVREYARAHGGSVELLPSVKGAHFRLTLPYENSPEPAAAATPAHQTAR